MISRSSFIREKIGKVPEDAIKIHQSCYIPDTCFTDCSTALRVPQARQEFINADTSIGTFQVGLSNLSPVCLKLSIFGIASSQMKQMLPQNLGSRNAMMPSYMAVIVTALTAPTVFVVSVADVVCRWVDIVLLQS